VIRIPLISLESEPLWPSLLLSLGLFWAPFQAFFGVAVLREFRRLREERRQAQAEAEAMAAEGFPPPDPPTTDIEPPESGRV
jgi:hypothetical protein